MKSPTTKNDDFLILPSRQGAPPVAYFFLFWMLLTVPRWVPARCARPDTPFGGKSDRWVQRIVSQFHPDRVILFGSAATGQLTPDSDIDLLVLDRDLVDAREKGLQIRRALAGLPFPSDVIVMSKDRFEETRGVIGGIAGPAARHGKVIYEVV